MTHKFQRILHPELYPDDKRIIRFVEQLNQPEVDSISDTEAEVISANIPPADNIIGHLEEVERYAQKKLIKDGKIEPFFTAFVQNHRPVNMSSKNPQTFEHVQGLLAAGKCLAFTMKSYCIFFTAVVNHIDGKIVSSRPIPENSQSAILHVGSTVRDQCLWALHTIKPGVEVTFETVERKIDKERANSYFFGRFYQIADDKEMTRILSQLPQMLLRFPDLTEKEAILNFAATMKVVSLS